MGTDFLTVVGEFPVELLAYQWSVLQIGQDIAIYKLAILLG